MKPALLSENLEGLKNIEHLLSSGGMLPAQLPSMSNWSPELDLAASVLSAALVEVRDHAGKRRYRRQVAEDLAWIQSNNTTWPFSFVRICYLLDVEPAWVRRMVRRWEDEPHRVAPNREAPYEDAA